MTSQIISKCQQTALFITFITTYKNGSKLPKTSNSLCTICPSNTSALIIILELRHAATLEMFLPV